MKKKSSDEVKQEISGSVAVEEAENTLFGILGLKKVIQKRLLKMHSFTQTLHGQFGGSKK